MDISKARPEEEKDFARLVLFSGPRLLPALFGPRVEELLRFLYRRPRNIFSFEHVWFAREQQQVIGVFLAIDGQTYSREIMQVAGGMLKFFKIGAIPLFIRLFRSRRLMKDLAPHQFYLNSLAVDPEFRGKNIGQSLLSAFEQEGQRQGLKEAALDVEITNPGASRFYLREGYSPEQPGPPVTIGRERFQVTRMTKQFDSSKDSG